MKKQKFLNVVSLALIALTLAVPFLLLSESAVAAPGTCYQGYVPGQESTSSVRRLPSCPDPVADGANRISYVTAPVETTTCHGSPGPTQMPYGTMLRFTSYPCNALSAAEQNTSSRLCSASGGTWVGGTSGGQGPVLCQCPAPTQYSSTTRQCATPQAPSTGGSGTTAEDGGVEIRQSAREGDCDAETTGGNLDGSNCGIIALLNTIFNFVSGGVAIAVVGNIIYAGIQYSTAAGDPSTAAKSKNRIRGAILAFLMYLSLFAFIQWLIPGGVF